VKQKVLKLNGLRREGEVKNGGIFGVYVFLEISFTIAKLRDPGTDFFWV
jgi:hypothetical protein